MENELTVREVVEGTIAKVQENMQMLVVFVLTLTVLGTALLGGFFFLGDGDIGGFEIPSFVQTAFGISAGIAGIALLIVAIVASYLLWELLLRRAGYYPPDSERRFFPLCCAGYSDRHRNRARVHAAGHPGSHFRCSLGGCACILDRQQAGHDRVNGRQLGHGEWQYDACCIGLSHWCSDHYRAWIGVEHNRIWFGLNFL